MVSNNSEIPILQTKNISKSFGHVQALKNVDLDLYPSEVVALIGDNGAGKSTLLKLLMNQDSPTKGFVSIPKNIGFLKQDIEEFKNDKVIDTID